MRPLILGLLATLPVALSACAPGALPGLGSTLLPVTAQDNARRGAVELAVKGNFGPVISDITAGGGPALERAFDAAGVPISDRPARRLQLSGDLELYEVNPGALVTSLLLWGG
ncbi:hypothetical protein [Limimaricola litoreus]|uniref:Uncharacterized protein n=1 Tax=Limimaricola litoreus TaxID=2955316 RepID=A0A9X2FQ28_9RHOB|nr:hypothetical protein [Limimaricola litoreus]MCP1169391.1 hypothetical protein [Limimaricola litoreus]